MGCTLVQGYFDGHATFFWRGGRLLSTSSISVPMSTAVVQFARMLTYSSPFRIVMDYLPASETRAVETVRKHVRLKTALRRRRVASALQRGTK